MMERRIFRIGEKAYLKPAELSVSEGEYDICVFSTNSLRTECLTGVFVVDNEALASVEIVLGENISRVTETLRGSIYVLINGSLPMCKVVPMLREMNSPEFGILEDISECVSESEAEAEAEPESIMIRDESVEYAMA